MMARSRILRAEVAIAVATSMVCSAAPGRASAQGLFEAAVAGEIDEPATKTASATMAAGAFGSFVAPAKLSAELNGSVRGVLYGGQIPDTRIAEIKSGYGEAALELRVRSGALGDGFAEVRVRHGLDGDQVASALDLREAHVNLYLGPLDLRLGHQIIAWGRADGFNPTDNLTPRDMRIRSPVEDDRRLASFALRTWLDVDAARIEAVWVPFYRPAHFPQFSLPGPITLAGGDFPDPDLENGTAAVRLNLETSGFDGSLSYLVGYAPFPGIRATQISMGPGGSPALSVEFAAFRHEVIGLDFSTTVSDWFGLRGEAAYRRPVDAGSVPEIPLEDLQYILGVDRELFGEVTIIAQYIGRYVVDHTEIASSGLISGGSPQPAMGPPPSPAQLEAMVDNELTLKNRMVHGQLDQIQHAAFLRLQWNALQDTLTTEVSGMYRFNTEEWFVRPQIRYAINDSIGITVGAEIYGGPDDTMFGLIDETQSAGYAELRASF